MTSEATGPTPMQNDKPVEALEPCPLCGLKADLWRAHPDRPARKAWIACTGRCCIMTREYLTDEEAIAAWNRRATLSRSDAGAGEELAYAGDRWKLLGYPSHAAECEDMANVGRALMNAIEKDFASHPFMKAWHPADCPTEIVGDLLNALDEAHPPAAVAGEQSLREIARDLLNAMHDGQERVGYRLDLWNALADALSQPAADAVGTGDRWRHKKRGTVYEKIGLAELQAASWNVHEGDGLVVYRGEDGKLWARHADEFHDGRFEQVALTTPPRQPDDAVREAERQGEQKAIARIVNVSRAIGWQAGVGGRETAGAIVSYLATSPDEIAPFVSGDLSPLDFAGDWMRGGCLTWHASHGQVVSPEEFASTKSPDAQAQSVEAERDADYQLATSMGFTFWPGGTEPPADWDEGEVLYRDGATEGRWTWFWGNNGKSDNIIGYHSRATPDEPNSEIGEGRHGE